MKGLEFEDDVVADRLEVHRPAGDRDAGPQARPRQVQEVGDHPGHALGTTEDAGRHPDALGLDLTRLGEQRRARRDGAEGRPQVVAEHPDELVLVEIDLVGEASDGRGERLVHGLVEALDPVEVGLTAASA